MNEYIYFSSIKNSDDQGPMPLNVVNPANSQGVIYVGVSATLDITLQNATGGDIGLVSGTNGSELQIFMPGYFTTAEVTAMTITAISAAGWVFSNPGDGSLLLSYTATQAGTWANGAILSFQINNVVSNSAPTSDTIQINPLNLAGQQIPTQVTVNLSLTLPVVPGNADLTQVLQANLDNQGTVFVSLEKDPLTNSLYLNFKNTGANPIYNDTTMWTGNPTVTISFVYGSTAGALAPDDKAGAARPGSAWQISAALSTNQQWACKNPTPTDQSQSPVWILSPDATNQDIIGTDDQSNVTFVFSNIDSFTPPGHTQMVVQFDGFMANSTTKYNSAIYTLDIVKQPAPKTRGLFNFFGTGQPVVTLTAPAPANSIAIELRWSMFYVDNINLICNLPGVAVYAKNYFRKDQQPSILPLNYDSFILTIPETISQNTPIFFTLQAFDHTGAYLNALQFTVFISGNFFQDPAGQVYPTIFINGQTWLAANYNFNSGSGSKPYNNNAGNEPTYGLLYTEQAAQANTPPGWRIPTPNDWTQLVNFFGAQAYQQLIAGGGAGFNAQLGGNCDNQGNFAAITQTGYYWTSIQNSKIPGSCFMAGFYSAQTTVNALGSFPSTYFLSVRYVKNS